MKIAIHQPQYFPWSPYVHKVMAADIFVYLDTVQFSKNGVQNRNQIKTAQGPKWLTVPVKHSFGQRLLETPIADREALNKHWKTIQANYSRSPGFTRWRRELEEFFCSDSELLAEVSIASTEWMLQKMNINARRVRASALSGIEGEASKLIASICEELGAKTYLTGTGALAYLDPDDFQSINCEVCIQRWQPFEYEQGFEKQGFVQDLSTLDLLLNCPDTAAQMIKTAGSWVPLQPK